MIELKQMFFPHLVDDMEKQAFLRVPDKFRAVVGDLLRHLPVAGVGDAFADFLVGDAFLRAPVLDRQVDVQQP